MNVCPKCKEPIERCGVMIKGYTTQKRKKLYDCYICPKCGKCIDEKYFGVKEEDY